MGNVDKEDREMIPSIHLVFTLNDMKDSFGVQFYTDGLEHILIYGVCKLSTFGNKVNLLTIGTEFLKKDQVIFLVIQQKGLCLQQDNISSSRILPDV